MASLAEDYRNVGRRIAGALPRTTVSGLYFPAPVPDETFRDEFGFVLLDDGSVGPFYVSMEDILETLWARFPDPRRHTCDTATLLDGFTRGDVAGRALAVGAYNALSAAVQCAAGFQAPDRIADSGMAALPPGVRVGMVGYFCPLVDKLTERGCSVLILERTPQRVDERPNVAVTRDPGELQGCAHVLCTAATLINDSLDDIMAAVSGHAPVELIGPTGSGLPDPLFERGVATVGGIQFGDQKTLLDCLDRGESWGVAGRKYQLSSEVYPGISALLDRVGDGR